MQAPVSGVQYNRWDGGDQDGVSMSAASSPGEASGCERTWRWLCTGRLGTVLKVLGGLALFWAVFILGYVTGYYVHKCK
ncbi:small integral membrane protein 1 [Choloepus didactylus]|uniref:small integral membrane protein 1 n=1 Tax=Choloepus didactylus TaxID=27675 RepID=UPI00189C9C63|nr:small integral membrane protein 1 [Choloepus didactylus]XP_037684628.1 small integral membrane protein 1 [Choloepus didactylus]XP_037684629.1 small integral membrane protein 1 [Choloepus didactylus]XP_037684630.1 small integral membrane protein 1 [Choloepus didactylus]XP_037684631.1 small integral membrane protein 1 [Choloepus didactylus]